MTLQRIDKVTISNWRSWTGESVLDDIQDGLVIFSGPNAIGKTGVWEAIVAGLMDKHRGIHTERLRPVGSSGLIPMVEIEFTADEEFYRIRKRFSKAKGSSGSTLYKRVKGSWKQIEEDDEAFILCRKIVAGSDADDISRGGHDNAVKDTLMQILLPEQGKLVSLAEVPTSWAGLGVDEVMMEKATQVGRVLTAVSNKMTMWNKGRTGLVKSDLKDHLDRLEQLEEEITRLEEDSDRIDRCVTTVRSVSDDLSSLGDAESHLEEARMLREAAEEHRRLREKAKAVTDAANAEADNANKIMEARIDLINQITAEETTLGQEDIECKTKEEKLKLAREALTQLIDDRDETRKQIDALRKWLDFETKEAKAAELSDKLEDSESRLDTVDLALKEQDDLNKNRANLILPDEQGWSAWDQLDERLKEAKGRMEAGSWEVSGSLPKGMELRIDEEVVDAQDVTGSASRMIEISSPEEEHRFVATAPGSKAESYEEIQQSVKEFLQLYGVDNIGDLRSQSTQATTLETKISRVDGQISATLGNDSRDALVQEIGRMKGELEKTIGIKEPSVDRPEGTPEKWEINYEIASERLSPLQSKIDDDKETLGSLDTEYKTAKVQLKSKKETIEEMKSEMVIHRQEFGEDDNVRDNAKEMFKTTAEADSTWKKLDDERGMAEDQKLKVADNLSGEMTEVIKQEQAISEIEGQLIVLRRDDPEGELAEFRAEQSRLQKIAASEETYTDALLLLEGALQSELMKHTEAAGGPIKDKMEAWLQYVFQDESKLIVSKDGRPCAICNPSSQDIDYIEQSFGTKEQISVLYRLALASIISEQSGSGVCLMFDDPFGYSDKGRRTRMLEIIEAEVGKLGHQVLLFTCRPEDFVGHGEHYPILGATD